MPALGLPVKPSGQSFVPDRIRPKQVSMKFRSSCDKVRLTLAQGGRRAKIVPICRVDGVGLMRNVMLPALIVVGCLSLALPPAAAKPKEPPPGHAGRGGPAQADAEAEADAGGREAVLAILEREGIDRDFVLDVLRRYGVVAASQSGLPPGIARNVARGKPLPPGIAKRHAPPTLTARLPSIEGHEWLQVGRDLVLVAAGTAVIVEILAEVFD